MVEADIVSELKVKKKKYLVKFTNQADTWSNQYNLLKQSIHWETYALCKTCNTDFSTGDGGDNDVKKHLELKKHEESVKALKLSQKMTSFLSSESPSALDKNAMKAELLFTGFICKHTVPISTADHAGKLLKAMFPDSKSQESTLADEQRQQIFCQELSLKSRLVI